MLSMYLQEELRDSHSRECDLHEFLLAVCQMPLGPTHLTDRYPRDRVLPIAFGILQVL